MSPFVEMLWGRFRRAPTDVAPEYHSRQRPERSLLIGTIAEAITLDVPTEELGTLTLELAKHYNQTLGGKLPDDVQLLHLIMPNKDSAEFLPAEERERYDKVSPKVKGRYDLALRALKGAGLETIGDFRKADYIQLFTKRNIGHTTLRFFIAALEPNST